MRLLKAPSRLRPSDPARLTSTARQRQIASQLTALGPASRIAGRERIGINPGGGEAPISALRRSLLELGPVFSALGRYLGSRTDLLPLADCIELAGIPDRAPATPEDRVRALVEGQLGGSLEQAFLSFDPQPFESGLLFQWHRARLPGGAAVDVKIVHPDIPELVGRDLDLVERMKPAFRRVGLRDPSLREALAEFRSTLLEEIDLEREAAALEALRRNVRDFPPLVVPRLHPGLSGRRVLTREHLEGWTVEDLAAAGPDAGPEDTAAAGGASPFSHAGRTGLASRLCTVWLRQALLGQPFPVTPAGRDVLILPDYRIAFTGGAFEALPEASKENLRQYLFLTAKQDPDLACSFLVEELDGPTGAGAEELRDRFRQAAPYRDGGWGDGGSSLAEFLFLHWRLATGRGLRPRPAIARFYRGLFTLAAGTRRLSPDRDPLAVGLDEFHLLAGLDELRNLVSPREATGNLSAVAAAIIELPRKLDEALTQISGPRSKLTIEFTESRARSRQRNRAVKAIALGLVLAAVLLLAEFLQAAGIGGPWTERAAALSILLIGGYLLWEPRRP